MRDTTLTTCFEAADADTRSNAIRLMTRALELIDGDATINAIAGAHLQLAIDSLWRTASIGPVSLELH